MDKIKSASSLPLKRRLVQLYAALLYNAHLKGFAEGEIFRGKTKAVCVPGLNCYSCPGAAAACPLGALQNAISGKATGPVFYVIGLLLLFGLGLGRVICGWACPFGLVQELLHRLPTPKLKKSRLTRRLTWLKYLLLLLLVVLLPLWSGLSGLPLPAFCKYFCPAGTLGAALPLLLHPANSGLRGALGGLFVNKLLWLVVILLLCVFAYRAFCRFLCPLGALYSLMSRVALLGVRLDRDRCTDCGACRNLCPMDIRRVGDRECIACGRCVSACPCEAIHFRAGGKTLSLGRSSGKGNPAASRAKRERALRLGAALTALLLLTAALLYCNLPLRSAGANAPAETGPASDSLGSAPGMELSNFSITTLDGAEFRLSEQRGRVVVLNLWATWCGPCVKELPLLDSFASAHADVTVLAIHSGLVTEDVPSYLSRFQYTIPFAVDESGRLPALLGASSMLPHTVILDREGVVRYNAPGTVTSELLEELYQSMNEISGNFRDRKLPLLWCFSPWCLRRGSRRCNSLPAQS